MKIADQSPLLHPLSLGALALLLVNDHLLKRCCASEVTGKLSDVAFMILAPLFLWTLISFPPWCSNKQPFLLDAKHLARARRVLFLSIIFIASFFTLMQTSSFGDWLFRYTLGVLQWPFLAPIAWLQGGSWPGVQPVAATADLTDLVCLPFLWVAWWLGESFLAARNKAQAQGS